LWYNCSMLLRFIENLRPIVPEVLECHQNKLPKGIGVKYVQDGESGKWFAVIRLEKEDLFTEANSREGLEYSVNDAVASYFDIPDKYFAQMSLDKRFYKDPQLLKNKKVLACS